MLDRISFLRQRATEREIEGSPIFPFKNASAIAADGFYALDFTLDNKYRKYCPFDNIQIINESDNPVEYSINDDDPKRLPAYGIEGLSDIAIWRFKIQNVGSDNINANEIVLKLFKSARAVRIRR